MKKHSRILLISALIIIFSTPLGKLFLNIIYPNTNLTGEYDIILKGFIHSFMLLGSLLFILGLSEKLKSNDKLASKN